MMGRDAADEDGGADMTIGSVRRTTGPVREQLRRQRDIRFKSVTAIVVGVIVGLVATAATLTVNALVGSETGYFLTLAAAVLAAWYTGLVGGVVAAITTVLLALPIVLTEGAGGGAADRAEVVRLVLYLAVATATVTLVAGRRAATIRLEDASLEVAQLAEKVAARDARLELMLAASGTGFWEWDLETNELDWSDAIFEQHGLEAGGTAPGFDAYLDMIHPDDRATFRDAIGAALDGGDGFSLEFRVVWPDGSVHWTHGAGRLVRDASGRPVRMLGTGQDITARRQAESDRDRLVDEERRAGEFREAFVEVISHELRTPITTILGLTHVLAQQKVEDDAARSALLEDVRAESERLHRLVEDLLVLSRVERGRLRVEAEPLMPVRLLERVVARESSELPSLQIELRIEPRLPIVSGEETYVEQIVRNLLGNAAKYAPAGTRVVVDARRDDGGGVAIRVLDEGPGISDASIDRVFELFYRDPDSARSVSGSGIGLFVCASLVESMGGRIWARRRPEGGTEIGFTLRPFEVDDDAAAAASGSAVAPASSG